MNRHQGETHLRLHMGCGESLHSRLLLGPPRRAPREISARRLLKAGGNTRGDRTRT
jgi:hypothetical protein